MQVDGSYTFKAPRQQVWDTLQSPAALSQCMPGCERFEEIGEDRYEATMRLSVGPIKGTYIGRIHLRDREVPRLYWMEVEGGGGPGHIKGAGKLTLEERDGRTVVSYDGDALVSGKIASAGQRVLRASAKQLINQFFKCVEKGLQ